MIMPRTSEGLYLLQRVRDEAHRFAITYHRKKRAAALTTSELDDVPGLGPGPPGQRCCGTSAPCASSPAASVEEIAGLPGIGPRLAETVVAALRGRAAPAPAATATGERGGRTVHREQG